MNAQPLIPLRELDSRNIDSLHVRLLWCRTEDRPTVAVLDTKTGDSFQIDVRPDESALDVFHHPYAYAALRGIRTGTTRLPVTVPA